MFDEYRGHTHVVSSGVLARLERERNAFEDICAKQRGVVAKMLLSEKGIEIGEVIKHQGNLVTVESCDLDTAYLSGVKVGLSDYFNDGFIYTDLNGVKKVGT